jgi:hypothetical protein
MALILFVKDTIPNFAAFILRPPEIIILDLLFAANLAPFFSDR